MAQNSIEQFKHYLNNPTDPSQGSKIIGALNTIGVNNLLDGSFAVLSHQVSWGKGTTVLGQNVVNADDATKDARSVDLLNAIERGVTAKLADVAIDDELLSQKISAYIENNNIIPDISVASTGTYTSNTGKYITGITANGHGITLDYGTIPTLTLNKTGEGSYVSNVSLENNVLTVETADTVPLTYEMIGVDASTPAPENPSQHDITLVRDITLGDNKIFVSYYDTEKVSAIFESFVKLYHPSASELWDDYAAGV